VEIDDRVRRHYENRDEDARLWESAKGALTRLRTWDIFGRFLPASGRIVDIGGGPGTHAAHLAEAGYEVVLVDPMERHLEAARQRAQTGPAFEVLAGDARELPLPDASCEAALVMGPLYHLVQAEERRRALAEAHRVLRPGGVLLAEIICRHAWVLDATAKDLLGEPGIFETFAHNIETGLSQLDERVREGVFWGYFHRLDELRAELEDTGFTISTLVAVEGFALVLGDLDRHLENPEPLLRVLELCESEPSMLGCSSHVMAVATRS
jgi:ubiquinone/menaquinone biosynthesis C-methylase UbiE